MEKELYIDGMTCGSCAEKIKKGVESVYGVSSISIDLKSKKAELSLENISVLNDVKDAIKDLGYNVSDLKEVLSSDKKDEPISCGLSCCSME